MPLCHFSMACIAGIVLVIFCSMNEVCRSEAVQGQLGEVMMGKVVAGHRNHCKFSGELLCVDVIAASRRVTSKCRMLTGWPVPAC